MVTNFLDQNQITYELFEHPPLFKVGDENALQVKLPGLQSKNLFLKEKKSGAFHLVCMDQNKRMNLKDFGDSLGGLRFSFASAEKLRENLGLEPGSVSIFGILNDRECKVKVYLDSDFLHAEKVAFHPNRNTATLVLLKKDFRRFLDLFKEQITAFDV